MQKKETRQMFQPIAATDVAGLPAPLPADSKRQAVHSISGTVYQAWCSIEAWTRLEHANQVIYLEGAEDFDIHDSGNALTVQVRQTSSPISLGTEKTRVALEHFWSLTLRSSPTIVEYHYLTTSTIARERDVDFDGLTGIEVWMSSFESVDSSIYSYRRWENGELRRINQHTLIGSTKQLKRRGYTGMTVARTSLGSN